MREGLQQADAVIVKPIKGRMAECADQRKEEERERLHLGPVDGTRTALRLPAIPSDHRTGQQNRKDQHRNWPMRETAPHGERFNPVDRATCINIRNVRRNDERRQTKA